MWAAKGETNMRAFFHKLLDGTPLVEHAFQTLCAAGFWPPASSKSKSSTPTAAPVPSTAAPLAPPKPPKHENTKATSGWVQVPAPQLPVADHRGPYVCAACGIVDAAATGEHKGCSNHKLHQCVKWDTAGIPRIQRNSQFLNLLRGNP